MVTAPVNEEDEDTVIMFSFDSNCSKHLDFIRDIEAATKMHSGKSVFQSCFRKGKE